MHLLVIEDERALCETIVRSLRRLAFILFHPFKIEFVKMLPGTFEKCTGQQLYFRNTQGAFSATEHSILFPRRSDRILQFPGQGILQRISVALRGAPQRCARCFLHWS